MLLGWQRTLTAYETRVAGRGMQQGPVLRRDRPAGQVTLNAGRATASPTTGA